MKAMTIADMTAADMLECLTEESRSAAVSYIKYLMYMDGQRKAERARRAFERVDAILDGDTGWASEEEMIADLAEFRRKHEAERSGYGKQQNRAH